MDGGAASVQGNVLFSDAHVEQLNDMFSLTNGPAAAVASLHMPSVRPPPSAPATTVQSSRYQYVAGSPSGSRASAFAVPGYTNRFGTNQGATNWYLTGTRPQGSLQGFNEVETVVASGAPVSSTAATRPNMTGSSAPPAQRDGDEVPWWSPQEIYQQVSAKGRGLLRDAAVLVCGIPWYLLLLLIVTLLEVRRRLGAGRGARLRNAPAHPASLHRPGVEGRMPHAL